MRAPPDSSTSTAATAERLRAVRQLAVETADEVRRVTFALAVPGHGKGNLTSDIRSLLRELERRSAFPSLATCLLDRERIGRRAGFQKSDQVPGTCQTATYHAWVARAIDDVINTAGLKAAFERDGRLIHEAPFSAWNE